MVTSRRCTRDSLKWSKKSRRNWNSYDAEDSASLHSTLRILAPILGLRARSLAKIERGFYQRSPKRSAVHSLQVRTILHMDRVQSFDQTNKYYNYSMDMKKRSRAITFHKI